MSEQKSAPPADPTAQPRLATGTELGRVAEPAPMASPFGDPLPAPINAAQYPPAPGEDMVVIRVPRMILLTLDDQDSALHKRFGTNRVEIPVGQYELPASLADHWYVKANSAHLQRRATAAPVAAKAEKQPEKVAEEARPAPQAKKAV